MYGASHKDGALMAWRASRPDGWKQRADTEGLGFQDRPEISEADDFGADSVDEVFAGLVVG
jgi:hypothetical protein